MLARYSILRELGRGATGAVYAARDRQTGRVVALKRLEAASSSKAGASCAERLLKQALSARRLKHRNIAEVHDAGEIGGIVYVAMEMLEGRNLRELLDAGPLAISRAIQIAHDIASGLAHAHLEGVVHGALKPSNVIVLPSGAVKVTDFGIGQLAHLSPEQVRGEPVDHRCDVFALGALLYEMLTRRPAFAGASAKEVTENILHAEPPPPSELNPHVPRALDAIVLSMLARQPASRMAGVPVLLRELQGLEEGLGLGSDPSAATDEPKPSVAPAAPEPEDAPRFEQFQHGHRLADREAFDYQKAIALMERESRRERSSGSRAIFAALAVVLAVLGIGAAGFMYYSSPGEPGTALSRIQERLATALAPSRPTPRPAMAAATAEPTPVAEATAEPAPVPDAPQASPPPRAVGDAQAEQALAHAQSLLARASERAVEPAEPAAAPGPEPVAAKPRLPTAKLREAQPRGSARLILAVSPRGELYVDGKRHGTTPPITALDLEPGLHRIEVRSGSRTPYLTYMTLQAGDVRRIRHDFDTSRAVHPPRSASWQKSSRAAR